MNNNLLKQLISSVKDGITAVAGLDAAFMELCSTADMTAKELEDFYYASNDIAKQMGVTTEEILKQAAAWNKLGYHTARQAAKMAGYSSMLTALSPGLDTSTAIEGLDSAMKAFKISAEDAAGVIDGIISKINIVSSTRSVDNVDIVNILTRSASAMAATNNTLEDTIALGAALTEVTGNAYDAAQILNTVSMRIRGYNEETGRYTGNVKELSAVIAGLTQTASASGGISLFSNSAMTEYKSTRQLLGEIAEIYDDLSGKQQTALLAALTGGEHNRAMAALFDSYEAVTASLDAMAVSAGNAEVSMAAVMDSIAYKMNRLKETGTGISQNLFGGDEMKTVLDTINSLGAGLDWLTEKLGLLGTASTVGAGFLSTKGLGLTNYVVTMS